MNYNRVPRNHFPPVVAATWSANNALLAPYDSSLVSAWKMDDVADSKGSNTLTNNGTITFDTGISGNAAIFASTPRKWFSNASPSGMPSGTGDFTFATWFYPTSFRGIDCLFLYNQAAWFEMYYTGNTFVSVCSDMPDGIMIGSSSTAANNWHHVVFTRLSRRFTIYHNGTNLGTSVDDDNHNNLSIGTCTTLNVGGNSGTDGQSIIGKLDETYVWNGKGFDDDDVTALYNSGTGSFYIPLT